MEAKIAGLTTDLAAAQLRESDNAASQTALSQQRKKHLPELQAVRASLSQRDTQMKQVQQRVDAATDEIFAAFSKRMGITTSVREFEETRLRAQVKYKNIYLYMYI